MNKFFTPSMLLKTMFFSAFLALTIVPEMAKSAVPTNFSGDPVFFMGPIGQSLGGAVYSMTTPHDNMLSNPAAGSFSTDYAANGSFSTVARTLTSSVFDTKSTSYGGGFTYVRREVDTGESTKPLKAGSVPQTYQSFGLSIFGKLYETFAIGVTGRYSMRSQTGTADINGERWNGDVGAAFRVSEKIGLGVVYKNLFGDNKNIDTTLLGGGAHIEIYPGLTLTGSAEKFSNTSDAPKYGVPDDKKIAWTLGGQYQHNSGVGVRASYRNAGPWDSTLAFAGLGYASDGFHVDYSFGTVTKGDKFTVHTFGLGATF